MHLVFHTCEVKNSRVKMARVSVLIVMLCQIVTLPILGGRGQDSSPLLDIASSFLQNMAEGGDNVNGMAAVGSIVGSLMQGDNAKNLGALFGQTDGGNAGDILSGLGSLLGGQDGKIDPALMGSMILMFAQQMGNGQANQRQKRQSQDGEMNLDSILSLASGFLGNKNTAGLLPLVMSTLNSLSAPEADKRAESHKDHASFLPPFLEKAHLYWDLFINSQLGKTIWEKSGLKRIMKAFTISDGSLSFDLMLRNFENHSFRRHWIKTAAKYLTDLVVHVAKPEVYQRYLITAEYVVNSFLDAQGFPSNTHFDTKRPAESLSVMINHALRRHLDVDTDVSDYVKPAIDYVKQTLKMAHATSQSMAGRDRNLLADRLTDTLNLEVIEPVLRVYRAYKHSVEAPHCQEHLMCLVNRHDKEQQGLPGFKAGLTKLSSLVASAALSFQNGKGFWDLYNAIQSDVNCEAKYPADCASFHEHELKVTTEVYHNEL
ncbi:unnamed protein product, partial [Iphiclides podalirius]